MESVGFPLRQVFGLGGTNRRCRFSWDHGFPPSRAVPVRDISTQHQWPSFPYTAARQSRIPTGFPVYINTICSAYVEA